MSFSSSAVDRYEYRLVPMREVIAVGLATALCRRILRHAFTIRVLELRRGHDWAQLQDRVTGPLNRAVSPAAMVVLAHSAVLRVREKRGHML
jgi:hypothetical protein